MKVCRKCNSTDIRTRKNYTHGKKSKASITLTCKKCNSADIEIKSNNNWRRNKKK